MTAGLILPWDRQPPAGTEASRTWRDRGLVALFDVRAGIEVINGNRATTNLSGRIVTSSSGEAADFSATQRQYYAHRPAYATTGPMSLVVLCDVDTLTNYGALITKGVYSSNLNYELRLGYGPSDSTFGVVRSGGGSYAAFAIAGADTIAAGANAVCIVITFDSSDTTPNTVLWVNRTKFTKTQSPSGVAVTDGGDDVIIASRQDVFTYLDGRIYFIGLFNRQLFDVDAQEIISRPWSLYEARRIWVPVSSSGGSVTPLTLTASLTSSAAIARQAQAQRTATAAAAAAIAKVASASKSASTSAVAARVLQIAATKAATSSITAARVQQTGAAKAAAVSSAATAQRATASTKTATTAIAAALAAIKTKLLTLAAAVTSSAAVVRSTAAAKSVTVTAAAAAVRSVSATRAAAATIGAALTRMPALVRSAATVTLGSLATVRARLLTLLATVSAAATVSRAVAATRFATVGVSGAASKLVRKTLATATVLLALLTLSGGPAAGWPGTMRPFGRGSLRSAIVGVARAIIKGQAQ